MEQWEYLSIFLEANASNDEMKQYIEARFGKQAKKYSPEALIPDLDKLGAQGWELLQIDPVGRVGRGENIQQDPYSWTATYFCVFKRRRVAANADEMLTNDNLPLPNMPPSNSPPPPKK